MSPPLPAMTHIQDRTYIPASAHQRNSNRSEEEEEHYNHDAAPPAALEEESANTTTATGIRSSQPSSSSSSSSQQQDSSSSVAHPDHDDLEIQQTTALAAASLHATLPAWAVAALQETLEQPWKAHFDGASGDLKAVEPDFGQGRDPVPFYDGRLKVCYGEGSMAA